MTVLNIEQVNWFDLSTAEIFLILILVFFIQRQKRNISFFFKNTTFWRQQKF